MTKSELTLLKVLIVRWQRARLASHLDRADRALERLEASRAERSLLGAPEGDTTGDAA